MICECPRFPYVSFPLFVLYATATLQRKASCDNRPLYSPIPPLAKLIYMWRNFSMIANSECLVYGSQIPLPATIFSSIPPSRLLSTCQPDPATFQIVFHIPKGFLSVTRRCYNLVITHFSQLSMPVFKLYSLFLKTDVDNLSLELKLSLSFCAMYVTIAVVFFCSTRNCFLNGL